MLVIGSEGRASCNAWVAIACLAGMLVGLAIDAGNGRLVSLGAICSFGSRNPVDSIRLHWSELPAMHAGMSVVMLGALPLGLLRTVRCYGLMLVGMQAGQTLSTMIVGMILGMAVSILHPWHRGP
jgi:hypothetical protein